MKIYTKTGDQGQTGLFGGPRVEKDDARIEAYGAVDELNSLLGVARASGLPAVVEACLARIQHELFALGAELATPDPAAHGTALMGPRQIAALEQEIDAQQAELAPLAQFVLPGGASSAAHLHLARTVCRRCERRVVTLARSSAWPVSPQLVVYLNRLGDLLFVLARRANQLAGQADVPWQKPAAGTPGESVA
jgi:cob(I)alamin adenosyltransferase